MDNIEILFKEYDTLRAEIIARTTSGYQILGTGAVLSGPLIALIGSRGFGRMFWVSLSLFVVFFYIVSFTFRRDITRMAARLTALESDINRLAGTELLKWETHYGVLKTGWIIKKKPKLR